MSNSKKAIITGITGQDGSYLAELLLEKGYEVHGLVRRIAIEDSEHRMSRISHVAAHIHFHPGALESFASLFRAIHRIQPDECYHLAAQSFVIDDEFTMLNANINGTHYLLSAIAEDAPQCRFYFAGSSEMFGSATESPQRESTPFNPRSAYGISKVAGFHLVRNYRDTYGLHTSSGILFNHESPRRGFEFVTKKITHNVAKIKLGLANELRLGNLDARRDWGHAKDFVRAMWMMVQQEKPQDFVIATGKTHSVRDLVAKAFTHAGLDYEKYVVVDPTFFRATEPVQLVGDSASARDVLGWKPEYAFDRIVEEMVEDSLERLKNPASKEK
jgi:GDPmannose 4,6-dehydratase